MEGLLDRTNHLGHLLKRAGSLELSWIGTTLLAVIVTVVVFSSPTMLTAFNKWRSGISAKDIFTGWSWKPGVLVVLALWAGLYSMALIETVYEDHRALVAETRSVAARNESLIAEVAKLKRKASQEQEAEAVISDLLGTGDAALAAYTHAVMFEPSRLPSAVRSINTWRQIAGDRLKRSPFRGGAVSHVLTQTGDLITEPLMRLRDMQSSLDRWIVKDSTS